MTHSASSSCSGAIHEVFASTCRQPGTRRPRPSRELAPRLTQRRAAGVVACRRSCGTRATGRPFFCMTGAGAPADHDARPRPEGSGRVLRPCSARVRGAGELADRSIEAVDARNFDEIEPCSRPRPLFARWSLVRRAGGVRDGVSMLHAGEAVDVVVMLDTDAPIGRHTITHRVRKRHELITADVPRRGATYPAVVGTRAMRACGSAYTHTGTAHHGSQRRLGDPPRCPAVRVLPPPWRDRLRKYRPSGRFDGHVVVVRGETTIRLVTTDGQPITVVACPATTTASSDGRRSRRWGVG